MKRRFKLSFIIICCVLLLLLTSVNVLADSTQQHISIPTQSEIEEHGYPVNQNGETYGPDVEGMDSPDLILAQNEEGVVGYVRNLETPGASVSTPEEAAEYMANYPSPDYIQPVNLYLQDGTTVIGKFPCNIPYEK